MIGWVHAAIWGVVKDFWRALIGKQSTNSLENIEGVTVPSHMAKEWTQRGMHLQSTHDAGRSYEDIVTSQGHWVMEDWVNWTLIYSEVVIMDDLRCGAWWCGGPTAAWHLANASGMVREAGCSVLGCCTGWCFGEYTNDAASVPA